MNSIDVLLLNFSEIRRRTILLWRSLPEQYLDWRPDEEALSFGEMIRHVTTSTYYYHQVLINKGSLVKSDPPSIEQEPIVSIDKEIIYSEAIFNHFMNYVASIEEDKLEKTEIDRSDVGYKRLLGDMLLRIGYHEAVHTGQFLQYMRQAKVERPLIWD